MINWEMYTVVFAGLGFFYTITRNFRNDVMRGFDEINKRFERVDARFDKVDARFDRIDVELKEIRNDITELKEGQAFLEAANIYTMPLEPAEPNIRSQAAKNSWVRRRQSKKRLANKK